LFLVSLSAEEGFAPGCDSRFTDLRSGAGCLFGPGINHFAKPGDEVQGICVEASFSHGGNADPARGGVQRRTFFYNKTTKQCADIRRDWD
jgi:hypothetical protein